MGCELQGNFWRDRTADSSHAFWVTLHPWKPRAGQHRRWRQPGKPETKVVSLVDSSAVERPRGMPVPATRTGQQPGNTLSRDEEAHSV